MAAKAKIAPRDERTNFGGEEGKAYENEKKAALVRAYTLTVVIWTEKVVV